MAALVCQDCTPTERIYLTYEGNFITSKAGCKVLLSQTIEQDGETSATLVDLAFDVSPFHPQGGVQPSDVGKITVERTGLELTVKKATFSFEMNVVTHHCSVATAVAAAPLDIQVGDTCTLDVDAETRALYSKYHTAGHLVDSAMFRLGYEFPPEKGYHFPDAPCVEYKGMVEADKRQELVGKLKEEFEVLVNEEIPTTICMRTKEECEVELNRTQKNFDFDMFKDPEVRIVGVANFKCPCGGTHVRSTKELSEFTVTGIKCKKGITKIKYDLKSK
ncbi:hypothetical protein TrLO_g320 [Triparma laevis f. longispina]|uniref:Threonyl/alanyl tRNA synthetase SAD domain-containing protein n=1 Tax=Triparma laevis f. longispina TaxID=1714387 RepID=A0A9W7A951_9STRA|nr:hypothetical protein TrLO_g320 [Triparma laevis f. longispina]